MKSLGYNTVSCQNREVGILLGADFSGPSLLDPCEPGASTVVVKNELGKDEFR